MDVKCNECEKEYILSEDEDPEGFQCECGGNLEKIENENVRPVPTQRVSRDYYVEHKEKEPILSLILSFFIVGLGHLYNGQTEKGIILVILGLVFAGLSIFLIGIPFFLVVWLYGMYDAYQSAVKINHGEEVKKSF